MTTSLTIIGTICHNDDKVDDPDHRRVEVWMDEDGVIWADRDNPHNPDVPRARDAEHAMQIAAQAWQGREWDFRPATLETATVDFVTGPVILTEGMIQARTGERIYGVFASEDDARSMDADERALASVAAHRLTAEQIEMARRNSERL